jgi:hypothetical protein
MKLNGFICESCRNMAIARTIQSWLIVCGVWPWLILAKGRFVDAEKAANRALAIDEDYWGGGCLQVGEAYFLMGEASRLQGFLGRAEFFYLESLPHRTAHLGSAHVDVAQVRARLALLGLIHGLYPDLNEMIIGCYRVYEVTPSTSEFIEFLGLPAMLRFFTEQNRRVEAEALYKNSMEALEATLGRSHRELGNLTRSWSFYASSPKLAAPTLTSWQKRVTSSLAVDENLEKRAEQHIAKLEYEKAENVISCSCALVASVTENSLLRCAIFWLITPVFCDAGTGWLMLFESRRWC